MSEDFSAQELIDLHVRSYTWAEAEQRELLENPLRNVKYVQFKLDSFELPDVARLVGTAILMSRRRRGNVRIWKLSALLAGATGLVGASKVLAEQFTPRNAAMWTLITGILVLVLKQVVDDGIRREERFEAEWLKALDSLLQRRRTLSSNPPARSETVSESAAR